MALKALQQQLGLKLVSWHSSVMLSDLPLGDADPLPQEVVELEVLTREPLSFWRRRGERLCFVADQQRAAYFTVCGEGSCLNAYQVFAGKTIDWPRYEALRSLLEEDLRPMDTSSREAAYAAESFFCFSVGSRFFAANPVDDSRMATLVRQVDELVLPGDRIHFRQ